MFNYLKAEMYRIFKKRSFYILILFSAAVYTVANFVANFSDNVDILLMGTQAMLQTAVVAVGIYVFTTVYNDDFNSKSMQAIIGYGIKRSKLVIYKIITTLLLSIIIYALLSVVFFVNLKLINVALSSKELVIIFGLVASSIIKILLISSIGGIFSFFYQKGVPGTIVFVLVISTIIDMLLEFILNAKVITDVIGDRTNLILGNVMKNFELMIATGDVNITAIVAIVVYLLGAMLITMLTFKNRELEF